MHLLSLNRQGGILNASLLLCHDASVFAVSSEGRPHLSPFTTSKGAIKAVMPFSIREPDGTLVNFIAHSRDYFILKENELKKNERYLNVTQRLTDKNCSEL